MQLFNEIMGKHVSIITSCVPVIRRVLINLFSLVVICVSILFVNNTAADDLSGARVSTSTDFPASSDRPINCENGDVDEPVLCGSEEANNDIGSSPNSDLQPLAWVGNPINLMSGNKFQRHADYAIPDSHLMLNRMYNSGTSDSHVGLGMGWRHSYALSILDIGDGNRAVIQSNGARLVFNADGSDDNDNPVMRAVHSNNGYLVQEDNKHTWYMSDGRMLTFAGSFLVRISWPDQRFLKLFYRSHRLQSVTDESGKSIVFAYAPGKPDALKGYEHKRFISVPSFLESVTLPDGSTIHYDYDSHWNLSRVRYPDETRREYHYEDRTYANNLTGSTDRTGVRYVSWSYDNNGRAVSSTGSNEVGKVTLEYPTLTEMESGDVVETIVSNSFGEKSVFSWKTNPATHQAQLLSSKGAGCVTCPKTGYDFTYDESGRVTSRSPNGDGSAVGADSFNYSYDEAGRLTEYKRVSVAGVESLIEKITYDSNFMLLPSRKYLPSINPIEHRTIDYKYNDRGQTIAISEKGFAPIISSSTAPLKRSHAHFVYRDMTPKIDGYHVISRTTQFKYDQGRLVEIDGARTDVDDVTRFSWDEAQRLVQISTPLGPQLKMRDFDSHGQAQTIQIGATSSYKLERDGSGTITAVRHKGMRYGYQYDAEKRLVGMTGPDGQRVSMQRDDAGRVVRTVDDVGRVAELEHDSENRLIGHDSHTQNGTLVRSLEYVFDAQGHIIRSAEKRQQSVDGLNSTRSFHYPRDAHNYMSGVTEMATGASMKINIDHVMRMTTTTMPNGAQQTLKADDIGQVVAIRDARQNTTSFLRDDFGRVVLFDSPDTGFERYSYNEAGHRIKIKRENGSTGTYQWDAAGRLTQMSSAASNSASANIGNEEDAGSSVASGPENTNWRYDPNTGMLMEVSNMTSIDQFAYDNDNQLIAHTRKIDGYEFTTSYSYDKRGRQKTKTLPDGQILLFAYHTDGPNVGSLRSIKQATGFGLSNRTLLDDIDTDSRTGTSGYQTQTGLRTRRTYNGLGEVQSITVEDQLRLKYSYNSTGQISVIEENESEQRFEYAGKQLTAADTIAGEFHYQYDIGGNRILDSRKQADGERSASHYRHAALGDGNRLLEQTDFSSGLTQSYEYRENGAPLSIGTLRYEYNIDGRPTAVYRSNQLLAQYGYNTFGERVKKTTYHNMLSPKTTYYLYDGTALSAEINQAGKVSAQYVYLNPARPVIMLEGSDAYAIHTDHLGAPRLMNDKNGVAVWSANYTPFGEANVVDSTKTLSLRLPGQYFDSETGTHYNYFRDYNPSTGRYLTSDPIGVNGGINTYLYANNNPIALFDNMGLAPAAEPLDGPLSPGGWTITAEQYNALAELANANRRVEYYFMLHNLTGSRLAFEMSQISSNSEQTGGVAWNANYAILRDFPELYPQNAQGVPDIQTFSEMIFSADFGAVEHYACGVDGPIYRIPNDTDMIAVTMGVWESTGLGHVAPPLIREMLDEYGDIYTQSVVGGSMTVDKLIELAFGEGSGDAIAEYLGQAAVPERYEDAIPYIIQATDEEMSDANGFYEPEFIRDHPGDVIETEYSQDCFSKIIKAPVSSRDPTMSEAQTDLYNDVSGAPEHDVIVVLTSGPEYMTCIANR